MAFTNQSVSNPIFVLMYRTLRRFLVIDEAQFILVEPDTSRLGWGVVKFVALLQVSAIHVLFTCCTFFTPPRILHCLLTRGKGARGGWEWAEWCSCGVHVLFM